MSDPARSSEEGAGSTHGSRGAVRGAWWALAGALVAGAALRLGALPDQVLADDEFHAVRAMLEWPLSKILVTYRPQDHSIPLTALYRGWLDAGGRLDELALRAPVVLCGVAALVGLPLWVASRAGTRVAVAFAWLFALSPSLVIYGRIVRSYAPVVLLGAIAAAAFYEFVARGEDRPGDRPAWPFAVAYAASAALAVWFHLGAAPLVASPLLFGGWRALRREDPGDRREALRALGTAAAGAALLAACWFLPARESLFELLAAKRTSAGTLTLAVVLETLQLQSGSRWVPLAIGFWGLAAFGVAAGLREGGAKGRLVAYVGTLVAGQAVGLWVLSPDFRSALLLNRWMLIALPMILLAAAFGLDAAARALALRIGRPGLAGVAVALELAGLAGSGPFVASGYWSQSFQNHTDWLRVSYEPVRFERGGAAAAPTELLEALDVLPEGPMVEYPWHPFWGFNRSFYAYQRSHGRRVLVANDDPLAAQLGFRNYVPLTRDRLVASGARLLVVHTDLPAEEERATEIYGLRGRIATTDPPYQRLAQQARRRLPDLEKTLGRPVHRAPGFVVFDLSTL